LAASRQRSGFFETIENHMKPIQVGLLGIGTVGSGTYKVLLRNQEEIKRRAGRGIEITMVADLDVERARGLVGSGCHCGQRRA
jgi:homoserine dehydrogenase